LKRCSEPLHKGETTVRLAARLNIRRASDRQMALCLKEHSINPDGFAGFSGRRFVADWFLRAGMSVAGRSGIAVATKAEQFRQTSPPF
jgi:hypothetical protein